jgi:Fic family protein
VAHIEAEVALEQRYTGAMGARALYSVDAVQSMHQALFGRLPAADRFTSENEAVVPGELRLREVQVGQHVAPAFANVPQFLERWASYCGNVRRGEAALVAMACAHQRLGWVHPFVDGNGRVMRLHTHTLLSALGYTGGLWSPLRGFARSTERYYALLADADSLRRGDLDGRGNLSEQALIVWADYVLDICQDQVDFMASMLDFETLKARIEACLVFEATVNKSDSPQGKVRFGLPQHALRFLFPRLWPEAEADAAAVRGS